MIFSSTCLLFSFALLQNTSPFLFVMLSQMFTPASSSYLARTAELIYAYAIQFDKFCNESIWKHFEISHSHGLKNGPKPLMYNTHYPQPFHLLHVFRNMPGPFKSPLLCTCCTFCPKCPIPTYFPSKKKRKKKERNNMETPHLLIFNSWRSEPSLSHMAFPPFNPLHLFQVFIITLHYEEKSL